MTITLAAVYAPIGIQGGLTGTLFREFAFTLAGAVIVSGVVALTLSPMMSSQLLRAGDSHRGFAGWINRRFDRLRRRYVRMLTNIAAAGGRSRSRWPSIIILLGVPVLPVLQRANSRRRKTRASSSASSRPRRIPPSSRPRATPRRSTIVFQSIPETATHLPDHPAIQRLLRHGLEAVERAQALRRADRRGSFRRVGASIPGAGHRHHAGAAARRRQVSRRVRHLLDGRAARARWSLPISSSAQAMAERRLHLRRYRSEVRHPQTEIVFDRDKVASLGLNLQQVGADLSHACSAAITSIASASRAAATRSSRR